MAKSNLRMEDLGYWEWKSTPCHLEQGVDGSSEKACDVQRELSQPNHLLDNFVILFKVPLYYIKWIQLFLYLK